MKNHKKTNQLCSINDFFFFRKKQTNKQEKHRKSFQTLTQVSDLLHTLLKKKKRKNLKNKLKF